MDLLASEAVLEKDRCFVWHPYTQHQTAEAPLSVAGAHDAVFVGHDGLEYIDACASWWVNLHGHCHPQIVEAISSQAKCLDHVHFAGCTHQPAVDLAEQLLAILPASISRVFYSDSGSTAVEIALKMVFQYFWNTDNPKRKVVSFHNGFHGETFGAMSAAGKTVFNKPFWPFLFEVDTIDPPQIETEHHVAAHFESILKKGDVACLIYEPMLLGAGGMRTYSSSGLRQLVDLCRRYGVLTIADEVTTGFGRLGPLFASESFLPDIICLAKGLTGGVLPLAVTGCSSFLYEQFLSHDPQKTLLHGHAYTANPIACAAAIASLGLLKETRSLEDRRRIADSHSEFARNIKGHPKLCRVESLGTILVLEYLTDKPGSYFHSMRDWLSRFFQERHIVVRPLGNVLYILPPYCISNSQLRHIYSAILESLDSELNDLLT